MSKAEERYLEYFQDGRVRNCSRKDAFLYGYRQAEKDNKLTWEDIKGICDIAFEEACRLQRNMKSSHIYKEQHYQEVLKRFKAQKGEEYDRH